VSEQLISNYDTTTKLRETILY